MFYESDLPDDYEVKTNEEAINALLRHLLDNAVQYTEQGVITLSCTEYGNMVRTSVTDTGKGISEEQRAHIFDTFREMGDRRKLQGLGLTICQAIVKLLGGKIWLDESYTEGTRFIFDIPKVR
jgi:signal transduction histidine kinase